MTRGDEKLIEAQSSPSCLVDGVGACEWSPHNYKHFPFAGMTRAHTVGHGNPARYFEHFEEHQIRALEVESVRRNDYREGQPSEGRTAYLRKLDQVIGWDEGQDAEFSYVECSGGIRQGRSFHGRPMRVGNAR